LKITFHAKCGRLSRLQLDGASKWSKEGPPTNLLVKADADEKRPNLLINQPLVGEPQAALQSSIPPQLLLIALKSYVFIDAN
jgi:hypothetical protein